MSLGALLYRMTGGEILIPYYHVVSEESLDYVRHLYRYKTPAEFERDLDLLMREFRPVSTQEIVSAVRTNRHERLQGGFHLTFDDGFSEVYTVVAPILKRRGIPATFFVCTGFVDNVAMAHDQKKSLLIARLRGTDVARASRGIEPAHATDHENHASVPREGRDGYADDASIGSSSIGSSSIREVYDLFRSRRVPRGTRCPSEPTVAEIETAVRSVTYQNRELLDEVARVLEIDFTAYLREQSPYLTSEQLIRLAEDGFGIGAHSIDHPFFGNLDFEEQIRQTVTSVRFVRTRLNVDYSLFAFPHSDSGVARKFYAELTGARLLDVAFGTSDMRSDPIACSFQRVSFESPLLPGETLLRRKSTRRILRQLLARDSVNRKS